MPGPAERERVVGWDPICGLPITLGDVWYDLGKIADIIGQPSADWCRGMLNRRRAELEQLLEEE